MCCNRICDATVTRVEFKLVLQECCNRGCSIRGLQFKSVLQNIFDLNSSKSCIKSTASPGVSVASVTKVLTKCTIDPFCQTLTGDYAPSPPKALPSPKNQNLVRTPPYGNFIRIGSSRFQIYKFVLTQTAYMNRGPRVSLEAKNLRAGHKNLFL